MIRRSALSPPSGLFVLTLQGEIVTGVSPVTTRKMRAPQSVIGFAQKSIGRETDFLTLGARAPSPSRPGSTLDTEKSLGVRQFALLRSWRARAPALPVSAGSFQIGSSFSVKLRSFSYRFIPLLKIVQGCDGMSRIMS